MTDRVDRYLKTSEVAEILHVSPKSITRWAILGKLPHSVTLGGHRRFPADEMERIAEELRVPSPPTSPESVGGATRPAR